MTRPAAIPTVQSDSSRRRVVEWRFAPGAATGWHTHAYDYAVVPMTTGRLLLEEPGGATRHAELHAGVSDIRTAGVAHDVINDNGEFVFVGIKVKQAAGIVVPADAASEVPTW